MDLFLLMMAYSSLGYLENRKDFGLENSVFIKACSALWFLPFIILAWYFAGKSEPTGEIIFLAGISFVLNIIISGLQFWRFENIEHPISQEKNNIQILSRMAKTRIVVISCALLFLMNQKNNQISFDNPIFVKYLSILCGGLALEYLRSEIIDFVKNKRYLRDINN